MSIKSKTLINKFDKSNLSISDLIRKRNKEILNEDEKYGKMALSINKSKIRLMDETVKPAALRDLEKEVDVDNNINKFIELTNKKISDFQFVVRATDGTQARRPAFQSVVDYTSLVNLYNSIISSYQKQGLAQSSRDNIKIKIEKLTDRLTVLAGAIDEYIRIEIRKVKKNIKDKKENDPRILEYIRAYAAYNLMWRKITNNQTTSITNDDMNTEYSNYINNLSLANKTALATLTDDNLKVRRALNPVSFDPNDLERRLSAFESETGMPIAINETIQNLSQESIDIKLDEIRKLTQMKVELKNELTQQIERLSSEIMDDHNNIIGLIDSRKNMDVDDERDDISEALRVEVELTRKKSETKEKEMNDLVNNFNKDAKKIQTRINKIMKDKFKAPAIEYVKYVLPNFQSVDDIIKDKEKDEFAVVFEPEEDEKEEIKEERKQTENEKHYNMRPRPAAKSGFGAIHYNTEGDDDEFAARMNRELFY